MHPILQTPTLHLRKLTLADLAPLIDIMQVTNPKATEVSAHKLIQKLDYTYQKGTSINWALTLNSEVIGTCGYYRGFNNATGELGYVMRPAFRRKGYMKEAIREIVKYGFGQLKLKRITAVTGEDNIGSIRLLEGLGFLKSDEMEKNYRIYEIFDPIL